MGNSDQYVTHADAARPVLHFTGRADVEATRTVLRYEIVRDRFMSGWAVEDDCCRA